MFLNIARNSQEDNFGEMTRIYIKNFLKKNKQFIGRFLKIRPKMNTMFYSQFLRVLLTPSVFTKIHKNFSIAKLNDFKMSQNFIVKICLLETKIKKIYILYKMRKFCLPPIPLTKKEKTNARNTYYNNFNIYEALA